MASDQSFYEAFRQAQLNREIRSSVAATEVNKYERVTKEHKNEKQRRDNENQKIHNMYTSELRDPTKVRSNVNKQDTTTVIGSVTEQLIPVICNLSSIVVSSGVSCLWHHLQHGLFHRQGGGGATSGRGRALGDGGSVGPIRRRLSLPGLQPGEQHLNSPS